MDLPVEIEFGGENASVGEYKTTPIVFNKPTTNDSADILEYEFESGNLLRCRVESYSKGLALFADFLRDAKKYYKKTCINARFIYFFSYRPMYRELNHEQLCWYLFWRSKIRGGEYIKTGLSYIFLYVFEQINLSDVIGAEKVCANIIAIWKNYRKEFPRIDKYIAEWLTDFVLINQLTIDLREIEEILPDIINIVTLPEFYLKEDFFANPANTEFILANMSVHNYKKSKFYANKDGEGKHKEMFDHHMTQIMRTVLTSEAFAKVLQAELGGNEQHSKATRESFMGAVCVFEHKKKITVEYKKIWKSVFVRGIITNAAREAENIIRDYLGIKSKLTILDWSYRAELIEIIREYKTVHLNKVKPTKQTKSKKKQDEWEEEIPVASFEPNLQTAAQIEKESWETTNTLLELQSSSESVTVSTISPDISQKPKNVIENLTSFDDEDSEDNDDDFGFEAINTDDDETDEFDEIFGTFENREKSITLDTNYDDKDMTEITEMTEMQKLIAALSDEESAAVNMLLNDSDFDRVSVSFMQEHGAMLEAVIESINEKAMDITGDIICENGQIIDDYLEQIQVCLQR